MTDSTSATLELQRWDLGHTRSTRTLGLAALFEEIWAGSAARDYHRESPKALVRKLVDTGYGALTIPEELGGADLPLPEFFDVVFDLGVADAGIAHSLRNHFLLAERANAYAPQNPAKARLHQLIGARKMLAMVAFDRTDSGVGFFLHKGESYRAAPVLNTDTDPWQLSGTTTFSTGNLYADYLSLTGPTADGRAFSLLVPTDRDGVHIPDDWDGVGQRTSASGTTTFTDVVIEPGDVVGEGLSARPSYASAFNQLYMTAIVAGTILGTLRDAVTVVQSRRSNLFHGLAELPRAEPSIQQEIGQLASHAFTARAAIRSAATVLDEAWRPDAARNAGLTDASREKATTAAMYAKGVVDRLALTTNGIIFDVGSGRTIQNSLALDRHWRNARTLASHNPASYKLRIVGNSILNGEAPPEGTFF